ncbi:uncharacterized protein B0H18DRAFT_552635 [Fomitopsis serialis]|uniref:uncharacterized protein n=1 Tax=Fomitopsis serialis TaxID=139415 RepID=UPI00200801EF|nr:uncharacterized protein B0H18DRAFT_552635 [Neoantrodia serialis]KAH9934296.1 hypothetical protein B0H18DRAFT_552635 [Neoantrodia serialis]
MRMSAVKTTPMRACASDTSPPAQTHQVCASRLNEPQHAARGPASKSRLLVDGIYHAQTHSGTARASSPHTDTACPRPNSANRTAMNVCQARWYVHSRSTYIRAYRAIAAIYIDPAHSYARALGHPPAFAHPLTRPLIHSATCQPTRPPASPRDRDKPARSMNPSRHACAGGCPSASAIQALAMCPPCANTPTSLVCRANNRSRRVRGHERITGSLPHGRLWCPHTTSSIRCCPSWPITALPVCVLAHALAGLHTLAHPLAHAPARSHSTCTPVRHTRPLACSPAVSLPPALTVSNFADHPSHTHAIAC